MFHSSRFAGICTFRCRSHVADVVLVDAVLADVGRRAVFIPQVVHNAEKSIARGHGCVVQHFHGFRHVGVDALPENAGFRVFGTQGVDVHDVLTGVVLSRLRRIQASHSIQIGILERCVADRGRRGDRGGVRSHFSEIRLGCWFELLFLGFGCVQKKCRNLFQFFFAFKFFRVFRFLPIFLPPLKSHL